MWKVCFCKNRTYICFLTPKQCHEPDGKWISWITWHTAVFNCTYVCPCDLLKILSCFSLSKTYRTKPFTPIFCNFTAFPSKDLFLNDNHLILGPKSNSGGHDFASLCYSVVTICWNVNWKTRGNSELSDNENYLADLQKTCSALWLQLLDVTFPVSGRIEEDWKTAARSVGGGRHSNLWWKRSRRLTSLTTRYRYETRQ